MNYKILILLSISLHIWPVFTFSLGNNLIVNSQFSTPNSLLAYELFNYVPGWQCYGPCQINNCSVNGMNCSGQVMDVSIGAISNITQEFYTSRGAHLFQLQFILPIVNSTQKTLLVYLNDQLIFYHSPLVDTDTLLYKINLNVYPLYGLNKLRFTSSGMDDYYGFRLASVSIKKILNESHEQVLSIFLGNQILKSISASPGSRVILGEIANIFISFDRLQLYRLHNRNYSYFMGLFIDKVSLILDSKGQLCLSLQKRLFQRVAEREQAFIDTLDYKSLTQTFNQAQDSFSFISNNKNIAIYSVPYVILIIVLMNGIFIISFNKKISKFFRKYSFVSIIFLVMLFQGNIEQFSFYVFGELTAFFSVKFKHKIVNCFIVIFFFVTVLCSTAFYLWFWSTQGKRLWCLVDTRLNFNGVVCYSIDRGIICILFGAVHSLLIHSPNLQLFVLIMCEMLWVYTQMMGLKFLSYKSQLLTWINIIEGMLRITFILSNYVYSESISVAICSSFINEEVHTKQIILFIGIWSLQLIICCFMLMKEIFDSLITMRRGRNPRKKQLKRIKPQRKLYKFKSQVKLSKKQAQIETSNLKKRRNKQNQEKTIKFNIRFESGKGNKHISINF